MPGAKSDKDLLVDLIFSRDAEWKVVATLACARSTSLLQLRVYLDELWPGAFCFEQLPNLLDQPVIDGYANGHHGVNNSYRQAVIRRFRNDDPARYKQLNALLVAAEADAIQHYEEQVWFARARHALHLLTYDPGTARPLIRQLLASACDESHRAWLVRSLDEQGDSGV
jgi:hypothetical protein